MWEAARGLSSCIRGATRAWWIWQYRKKLVPVTSDVLEMIVGAHL